VFAPVRVLPPLSARDLVTVRRSAYVECGGLVQRLAAEEFGCAVAPLLVFALLWLLAESPQRPNPQAPLA
jgi:hypothetical protein